MTRILFLCSHGYRRSPTAAWMYSLTPDVETRFAATDGRGLNNLTLEDVAWADIIVCMEAEHSRYLDAYTDGVPHPKKVITLDLPDVYDFMYDDTIAAIERSTTPHLGPPNRPQDYEERKQASYASRYG